jgi:hypothetical protein
MFRMEVHSTRNRQVFGLAGSSLIPSASQTVFHGSVPLLRVSFPLTAAGQSRIRTGFPFQRRQAAYRITSLP